MTHKDFFPQRPRIEPKIYAYEDTNPQYAGLLKIGYTTKSVQERVAQQYPTLRPGEKPYRIVVDEPAIRNDGTGFTDHDVHRMLRINGIPHAGGEWFRCTDKDVQSAINAVRAGQLMEEQRSLSFGLRPEQEAAIQKTVAYFQTCRRENDKPPHFLWNCKMRFGKTFAAYQLAKRMGWKKMLVLTFKPAVQSAWEEDLRCHVDFQGWQFIKPGGLTYEQADKNRPIVCFGSFQDYLGRNPSTGGIKTKNESVHTTHWDCVMFDEYHFGAWREKAKDLFESEDEQERKAAEGVDDQARFTYEEEVQKWLDLIRGAYLPTSLDNLKLGAEKPPLPFSDMRLLNVLSHTLWFLPSVASCYAMQNLLAKSQNKFYHDYKVIVAAGAAAGIGVNALPPVLKAMGDPLKTKTITLTCGKLTTGVTVRPWTGIFMLRNTSSPETYFQAAFRVQSPWTIQNPDGVSPNEELILKEECYVFDFAPDRALRQIADYSCRLNVNGEDPEKKVAEFIQFLPVLAYDGSSMRQIDAAGVLDMAMAGTTATLLARRWESALLVNVDDDTLRRLMNNKEAMQALMRIEGFRNLNQEIETIINKSEAVKKAKKEANDQKLSSQEKKQLTEEEKEFKSKRKQIQEKLIKLATRIPIFMYLTDYRERTLRDVITQLEPGLFKKVTGLTVKDFELLVSLGVFNSALMNDAVYKFKRYEDPSLAYTGINKHEGEDIGLYDTVLRRGNCPSSLPEVSI
ncbi:GIY-YIG nuclease family protein [Thermosynechococcus sp. QS41]|uniref:GIY-YIG nuclease family protein n=1 Tax=Thermosynechococcus sp. QS41 TaxID=3074101 RepID=UPI0028776F8F|nr:GIY-YIG nuclease family protein [Thermosynechococcus sp. QS41]WNC60909.1 GIY-YIG nuclease family protein [Thermosynechococcus sp. QS41]